MKIDATCVSEHTKKKRNIRSHKYNPPELTKPWPYVDVLLPLSESLKVNRDEFCTLECHDQYSIKHRPDFFNESEKNDELYRIFGELVNKAARFMRQWARCFTLTHRKFINKLAGDYFKTKGMELANWTKV